jgi:hypothetical protein
MERHQDDRSPDRLSDEELEYYGNLYIECQITESGLDFESFLGNPEHYLRKFSKGRWRGARDDDKGRKGLLRYLRLRLASRTPPR